MMDLDQLAEDALRKKKEGKGLTTLARLQKKKRKEFLEIQEIEIDDVYKNLIRKQTPEEQAQLKESIKTEGIRDALVVYSKDNKFVVVDGHHRLAIAKELNLQNVPVEEKQFGSVDEARIWMLKNQLGRRNLNDAERIEIALQLTAFLETLGTENKQAGKNLSANLHKGHEKQKIDRLQEASNISNVSRRNVAKYKKVVDSGDDTLRQEVIQGKKSIHKAHQEVTVKQSIGKSDQSKSTVNSTGKTYPKKVEKVFKKIEDWKRGKLTNDQIKEILASYVK